MTASQSVHPLAELHDLSSRLVQAYHSILAYDTRNGLPGLRFLREEVKRDCEVLDKVIDPSSLRSNQSLSTNAPYLIAVWDELIHARRPIAIYRSRETAQVRKAFKGQTRAVKVDVVAENGARWVRNSRIRMEFREIDSPHLAQTEFDNSVLRMGRELLAAAKANPISVPAPFSGAVSNPKLTATPDPDPASSSTLIPKITIRLTRLDPFLVNDTDAESDPRIEQTIRCLREMGIDKRAGTNVLEPTNNINLDLSALIALISDITHSHLPLTPEGAHARFVPPQTYVEWKKDRVRLLARQSQDDSTKADDGVDESEAAWEDSGQHSRALAVQTIQEMERGILDDMYGRLSAIFQSPENGSTALTAVQFWTTSEARQRCLQIVSKIGGKRERQRADALLEDAYWEHSRYPTQFLPLVPVHVFPSTLPCPEEDASQRSSSGITPQGPFFEALASACTGILSLKAGTVNAPIPLSQNGGLEEIRPVIQTALPKLTTHTVSSMLAGSSRGYTTLTTNRSSVKSVMKEMHRVCGRGVVTEKAALWIVNPRSLAEGMRSDIDF
ncbi:hypothetical protein BU15DRAFT_88196 [Melanogaster broomeanus]|nr:hypothetical protein BU15DRAFT_88196 [Melanogaster broomeanus]